MLNAVKVALLFCLYIFGLSPSNQMHIAAQNLPQELVHICIEPPNYPSSVSNNTFAPYLLTVRTSTLFGILISENANATVYNATNSFLAAGVYTIAPDANTGGYRRINKLAQTYAQMTVPRSSACETLSAYSATVTNLSHTMPLTVSSDHALFVHVGAQNSLAGEQETVDAEENSEQSPPIELDPLDTAPVLGVYSFHIRPVTEEFQQDLQVLQLAPREIDISFPFLQQDTRIAIVSNKEIFLQISLSDDPSEFAGLQLQGSDQRPTFIATIARDVPGDPPLLLFQMLKDGLARIYPSHGSKYTYRSGGFIRLLPSDNQSFRDPQFLVGDEVCPLAGTEAPYRLPGQTDVLGTLKEDNRANIVRIDDLTGELIVNVNNQEVVIEAWLTEVCQ